MGAGGSPPVRRNEQTSAGEDNLAALADLAAGT